MSKKTSGRTGYRLQEEEEEGEHASKTKREKAQPLNDHPVHPYLFFLLSLPSILIFRFSSLRLLCTGGEGAGAVGTIIRNCFP